MSQQMNDLKPLFLSAEEAMGLLDLCMLSHAEFDREKERALLKLSDLVRQHLSVAEVRSVVRAEAEDSILEAFEAAREAVRQEEHSHFPLSETDFVHTRSSSARRAALKPCPAEPFRYLATAPGP